MKAGSEATTEHSPNKVAESSPPVKKEQEDGAEPTLTTQELVIQLTAIKNEGNAEFKAKSYIMAIAKFTEGTTLYGKNTEVCKESVEIKTLVTQLFTNRALARHNLGDQENALKDADYVLEFLDKDNCKALFRRAHSYRSKGQLHKAL